MNLHERYRDIVEQYPQFITQMQFCEITGMCISSVYKLLKTQQISHRKRNKRLLHYYDIPLTEAMQYKYRKEFLNILAQEGGTLFLQYYGRRLHDAPDVLLNKDIQSITGYTSKTVGAWLLNGEIIAQIVGHRYVITKDDLLDFLVSHRYFSIIKKSPQHLADIKVLKEMSLELLNIVNH